MNQARAFDAREVWLCQRDCAPDSKWRVVSLVTGLRALLSRGPDAGDAEPSARLAAVRRIADELGRRGLDADSLIRYGMCPEIISPVVGGVIMNRLTAAEDHDPKGDTLPHLDAWVRLLPAQATFPAASKGSSEEFQEALAGSIVSVSPMLVAWVFSTRMSDLVNLVPPGDDEFRALADEPAPDLDTIERYRWIVDRFSETFLRDWSTSSLHLEYRWAVGREASPCSGALMIDRSIAEVKLQAEIARRAVFPPRLPALASRIDAGGHLVVEMEGHALTLLAQGRHLEAAALFEFAGKRRPDDPTVLNDLGFCLLPVNPQVALAHLVRAAELGYHHAATNTYNTMCAHIELRDAHGALKLADRYWTDAQDTRPHAAVLWHPQPNSGWALRQSADVRRSIAELAHALARAEGWKQTESLWDRRLRQPGGPSPL